MWFLQGKCRHTPGGYWVQNCLWAVLRRIRDTSSRLSFLSCCSCFPAGWPGPNNRKDRLNKLNVAHWTSSTLVSYWCFLSTQPSHLESAANSLFTACLWGWASYLHLPWWLNTLCWTQHSMVQIPCCLFDRCSVKIFIFIFCYCF